VETSETLPCLGDGVPLGPSCGAFCVGFPFLRLAFCKSIRTLETIKKDS
jgi:hypothetical protein